MDRHTKEQRHKNMQAVKGKNTKLENNVMTYLWKHGYRFRKNVKDIEQYERQQKSFSLPQEKNDPIQNSYKKAKTN